MNKNSLIQEYLRYLKLSTLEKCYEEICQKAAQENLPYENFYDHKIQLDCLMSRG